LSAYSFFVLTFNLTQLFSSVRVTRLDATGTRVAVDLPPGQHQNLFGLAQAFVEGTKCRITNALCGRIALMVCFGPYLRLIS
jgi:hypothetical protein